MVPTTEKKEKVPTVPSFIDDAFIATLPKEKQAYWANRKKGQRGMPNIRPQPKVVKVSDTTIGFDNDGNMIAKSRAVRRRKLPSDPKYTKATHSLKKIRGK